MKKRIALCMMTLFCLTACTSQQNTQTQSSENTVSEADALEAAPSENNASPASEDTSSDTVYTKAFGTYTVPNGWIESSSHSTEDKFFYISPQDQQSSLPNNISVNMGQNPYSAQDHASFRKAILNQLAAQLPKGVTLNGNGSYTANDYTLYTFTFTITEEENSLIATQYYIVGDYKYVMVYESVYDNANKEETDNVAKTIVDTFVWAEP